MSIYSTQASAEDEALTEDNGWCAIPNCYQEPHPAVGLPVCRRHATLIARDVAREQTEQTEQTEQAPPAVTVEQYLQRVHHPTREDAAHVYYLALPGGNIKIGYSTNVPARIRGLRLDPHVLLATEVGGPKLERERLRQFADLRIGRREDFAPGDELLEHIRKLRDDHDARNPDRECIVSE